MTTATKQALAVTATAIAIGSGLVSLAQAPSLTQSGVWIAVGAVASVLLVSAALFQLIALLERIKHSQQTIEQLKQKLSTLDTVVQPGEYIFIDGEKPAFDALIAATLRAKHHVRSTRFSDVPVNKAQPDYAEAIRKRVLGRDGYSPLQHYSRIIAVNHQAKIEDIKTYIREFFGRPFTFYLTTQEHNFELVVIDDTEVFIHFYSEGSVIGSTLHIPSKAVAGRFKEIFNRFHKRHVYQDIKKFDCSQILEKDIEQRIKDVEEYFAQALAERHPVDA